MGIGLAALPVLALIDSTSFGTLGIPVYLMVSKQQHLIRRLLTYLATITAFYYLVGVALMFGARTLWADYGHLLNTRTAYWVQLGLGVALFAFSFTIGNKKKDSGWQPRIDTTGATVVLGITAGLVEVASMVPFLAAIAIITETGLSVGLNLLVLAGYSLIMVLPPLLLLGLRMVLADWLDPRLERLRDWIAGHAASTMGWAMGIIGFLLARDAIRVLFSH
ncbi:hypothetical protein D5S17_31830 [Pseudonocardiaceae bacterium YIM PH 21723]|nr:hypothetical protein D5S17_31830 [Pseudonocardiaceae bacterium YIM PH 21723]